MNDAAAATTLAIATRGLTRRFGAVKALDDLNLEVPAGSFFAVVGPNGAGKSTSVRILAGIIRRSSGCVAVLGHDPDREPSSLKARIGVVPDFPVLYDELTPRQNILRIAGLRGLSRGTARDRLEEMAIALGLAGELSKPFGTLSHGTRKKATLAAAMLHAPALLFLDEPFEGIDPISADLIRRLLDELRRRGVTVFLTSHVMPVVEALATHVAILDRGRLLDRGTMDEVRGSHPTLERALIERLGTSSELPRLDWYRP